MLEMPESWNTCRGKLPKREKRVTIKKVERSWRSEACFDARPGDAEFGVCPIGFGFDLAQYFLTMLAFRPSGMVVDIPCHYM